jgi:hypothetical protein
MLRSVAAQALGLPKGIVAGSVRFTLGSRGRAVPLRRRSVTDETCLHSFDSMRACVGVEIAIRAT